MSEARLLWLVARYPHATALARRAGDGTLFPVLRRLEARGYVRRQRDRYRLTRTGRNELAMTLAVMRLSGDATRPGFGVIAGTSV